MHFITTEKLHYRKLCAHWVLKMLTEDHKANQMITSPHVLQKFHERGNNFLSCTVTGDKTWIYQDTLDNKNQSMQWKHPDSPCAVKFKQTLTKKKIMASVFCDCRGIILVEFVKPGTIINGAAYRNTLNNLQKVIKQKRPRLLTAGVKFLRDNARLHTAHEIHDLLSKFGWNVIPYPSYSPDLAPSDYHLFPALKQALEGQKFNTDELKSYILQWFKNLAENFFMIGIEKLIKSVVKCININGSYAEK